MLVEGQLEFLTRFFTPRTVFMDVGAGDCALALSAASFVERVYAVEASELPMRSRVPCNVRVVTPERVVQESVDVAFSARPRLRATEELTRIYRSLAPGGIFFCVPGSGFSAAETRDVCLRAGFRSARLYARIGKRFVRVPFALEKSFSNIRVAAVK
jgi:hypothetical protein